MNVYHLKDAQVIIPESRAIQKLYVELTGDCNLACDMCFRHSFPEIMGSMDDKLLEKLYMEIDALPELKEIVLGGIGEPFLHPRLGDFINFAKQRGKAVSITSNGTMQPSQIDLILKNRLDKLYLSFETGKIGHTNEETIFDLVKTIAHKKRESKQANLTIHLLMVLTSNNIHDLPRIGQRLKGGGINSLFMSNLLPTAQGHNDLVLYPNSEPNELKRFKSELLKEVLPNRVSCSAPNFEIKTERFCEFVEQNAMVVRWDGAVAPCYRFLHTGTEYVEDRGKEIRACTYGNVLNESLLDIWNKRNYAWFRFQVHNSIYPSCIDCQFKEGCEFITSTISDCWGNENSCADCLWARGIIRCP